MAVAVQTMTDEQRKSVALEYLKAFDNGGVTSHRRRASSTCSPRTPRSTSRSGASATGQAQIGEMFGAVGGRLKAIRHDYANFNWIMTGSDTFACEGTSLRRARGRRRGAPA